MALTPYQEIYDAFLPKISEDEWTWSDDMEVIKADWRALMQSAIPYFKFPRVSLEQDTDGFINKLSSQEIQVIATYMKVELLERTVSSWENVKSQYAEGDFSQANFLDKLTNLLERTEAKAERLQHNYYRAPNGRPYPYSGLAGGVKS